ncbi:hypothetical protein D3C81_482600 [compost metagenome]
MSKPLQRNSLLCHITRNLPCYGRKLHHKKDRIQQSIIQKNPEQRRRAPDRHSRITPNAVHSDKRSRIQQLDQPGNLLRHKWPESGQQERSCSERQHAECYERNEDEIGGERQQRELVEIINSQWKRYQLRCQRHAHRPPKPPGETSQERSRQRYEDDQSRRHEKRQLKADIQQIIRFPEQHQPACKTEDMKPVLQYPDAGGVQRDHAHKPRANDGRAGACKQHIQRKEQHGQRQRRLFCKP